MLHTDSEWIRQKRRLRCILEIDRGFFEFELHQRICFGRPGRGWACRHLVHIILKQKNHQTDIFRFKTNLNSTDAF